MGRILGWWIVLLIIVLWWGMFTYSHAASPYGCQWFPHAEFDEWSIVRWDKDANTANYRYDTNGDGSVDMSVVYKIEGYGSVAGTNSYPVLHETPYVVVLDMDYDGEPDMHLYDASGTGKCGEWVGTPLDTPQGGLKRIDPTHKKKGEA